MSARVAAAAPAGGEEDRRVGLLDERRPFNLGARPDGATAPRGDLAPASADPHPATACGLRLSGPHRQAFIAEVTTVLAGGFMLVWYLVLDPLGRAGAPNARWIIQIGVPLADLLLVVAVTALLLRGLVRRLLDPITFVVAGMVESRRPTSVARYTTKAGSVAQLSIPVSSMPCGSAAVRARSRYWPI